MSLHISIAECERTHEAVINRLNIELALFNLEMQCWLLLGGHLYSGVFVSLRWSLN